MRRIRTIWSMQLSLLMITISCALIFWASTRTALSQPSVQLSTMLYIQADRSVKNAYDCTQVGIDEIDPALLTKEERIALLDKNLDKSMDSFSHCVSVAQSQMTGGGSGGGKGDIGINGSDQWGNGTSVDAPSQNSDEKLAEREITIENQQDMTKVTDVKGTTPTVRGVIPPKNNDKVICKLLYQEIVKTTDPKMLGGLKQQYANYKCG